MPRVSMAVARERQSRVLRYLDALPASEKGHVEAAIRDIAQATDLKISQARSAYFCLKREGFVKSFEQTLPNGGSTANAYLITSAGRRFLEYQTNESQSRSVCSAASGHLRSCAQQAV